MKFVFLSNYFNQHQKPFSDAMYGILGDDYCFIETEKMDEERAALGWDNFKDTQYLLRYYERPGECQKRIDAADVVIFGSAPSKLVKKRVKTNKLVFRYAERQIRKKPSLLRLLFWYFKWHRQFPKNKNIYLLCASAYSSEDYAKLGVFKEKAFKWGYFPEKKSYDVCSLMSSKDPANIVWVGRFIELKRPLDAVEVAAMLKNEGIGFSMTMIGSGEEEQSIRDAISSYGLDDEITLTGAMPHTEVRCYMERAGIFLFTSDQQEGWGAVLNEAMNSGCAVVTSHAAGSTPYLVSSDNGYIYRCGDINRLFSIVKTLLQNPERQYEIGKNAYDSIATEWNADVAAKRLIELSRCLTDGKDPKKLFSDGPCSAVEKIKDDWFDKTAETVD